MNLKTATSIVVKMHLYSLEINTALKNLLSGDRLNTFVNRGRIHNYIQIVIFVLFMTEMLSLNKAIFTIVVLFDWCLCPMCTWAWLLSEKSQYNSLIYNFNVFQLERRIQFWRTVSTYTVTTRVLHIGYHQWGSKLAHLVLCYFLQQKDVIQDIGV